MNENLIPELIAEYNAYTDGDKLIGVTGKTDIAELNCMTESISGAGIGGAYDSTVPGQMESSKQTINFRTLNKGAFKLAKVGDPVNITLRASHQLTDRNTGALTYQPIRVVEKGRFLSLKLGGMENGKPMDGSITFEVLYQLIEINGEQLIEFDKLNGIFKQNGQDVMADIRKYS